MVVDDDVASDAVYSQRDLDDALTKERALHKEALATMRREAEANATKCIAREEERRSEQPRVSQESKSIAPAHAQCEATSSQPRQAMSFLSQQHVNAYQVAYHVREIQDRAEERVREEYLMRMRKAERERDLLEVLAATGCALPKFPGNL